MAPLLLLSAITALGAWYSLIRFLEDTILPIFFEDREQELTKRAQSRLRYAVRFSFISIALRLLLSVLDLALNPFGFG